MIFYPPGTGRYLKKRGEKEERGTRERRGEEGRGREEKRGGGGGEEQEGRESRKAKEAGSQNAELDDKMLAKGRRRIYKQNKTGAF